MHILLWLYVSSLSQSALQTSNYMLSGQVAGTMFHWVRMREGYLYQEGEEWPTHWLMNIGIRVRTEGAENDGKKGLGVIFGHLNLKSSLDISLYTWRKQS